MVGELFFQDLSPGLLLTVVYTKFTVIVLKDLSSVDLPSTLAAFTGVGITGVQPCKGTGPPAGFTVL